MVSSGCILALHALAKTIQEKREPAHLLDDYSTNELNEIMLGARLLDIAAV